MVLVKSLVCFLPLFIWLYFPDQAILNCGISGNGMYEEGTG